MNPTPDGRRCNLEETCHLVGGDEPVVVGGWHVQLRRHGGINGSGARLIANSQHVIAVVEFRPATLASTRQVAAGGPLPDCLWRDARYRAGLECSDELAQGRSAGGAGERSRCWARPKWWRYRAGWIRLGVPRHLSCLSRIRTSSSSLHWPYSKVCQVWIRRRRGCGSERFAYATCDRCLDCRGSRLYELALRLQRCEHFFGANAQLCRQLVHTGSSSHAPHPQRKCDTATRVSGCVRHEY